MSPFWLETLGTAAIVMMFAGLSPAVRARAHKRMIAVQGPADITNTAHIMFAAVLYFKNFAASPAAGVIYGRPDGLQGLFVGGFLKENCVVFPGAFFAEGISGVLGVEAPRGCRNMQSCHQASVTPPDCHFWPLS
jgi:hypothetical protein